MLHRPEVGRADPQRTEAVGGMNDAARRPRLGDLWAAIAWLTVVPLHRPACTSDAFGRATVFFPAVGLLLGAGLAAIEPLLAARLPGWITAVLMVALWEAATGGALLRRSPDGVPRRFGTAVLAAMILATKVAALAVARPGAAALLFAPMLGRWSMVVLAAGARDAQAPGRKFNSTITFREFALASVCALAIVFAVTEAVGILVALWVAALTLGLRLQAHRRWGGISWPYLATSAEGVEALVLALFALL